MGVESNIRKLCPEDTPALVALRREALDNDPLAFGAAPADDRGLSTVFVRSALADVDEQAVFGHFDGSKLTGMVGVVRATAAKRRHQALVWGMYLAPPATLIPVMETDAKRARFIATAARIAAERFVDVRAGIRAPGSAPGTFADRRRARRAL